MTIMLLDTFWVRARNRVEALGHKEEDDPARWEQMVKAAYEDERRRGHILFKTGIGRMIVMKSIGMEPKKRFEVKKKITGKTKSGKPEVDGWAQGRRPDYKTPVHGRVTAVGRDGIVIRDDTGRRHRIRHEHVVDFQAALTEKEWPKAAKALAESGEKVDPVSRFRKPEAKVKPDKKLVRRIKALKKKDKRVDIKRALKEGSVEDLQALVDHYKDKKPMKKSDEGHEPYLDTGTDTIRCSHCGADSEHRESMHDTQCWNCREHWNVTPHDVAIENGQKCVCGKSGPLPILHAHGDGYMHSHEDGAAEHDHQNGPWHNVPDRLPPDIQNMKSMRVWRV